MAKKFYWGAKTIRLPYHLRDQFLRASSSVVLNLAEGAGKRTPDDQHRFWANAFGSLRECRAILEMEKVNAPELNRLADQLSAILYKLSRRESRSPPAATARRSATDIDTASATDTDTGHLQK